MGGYLALLRPGNGVVAAAAVVTGGLVARPADPNALQAAIAPLVLGAAAAFAFTGAGNALNDYLDREIDTKAHPDRPLPSGRVSPEAAQRVSGALFLASLIFAGAISPAALAFVAALAGLMLAYELWLKSAGLTGNLAIGVLSGITFAFGGIAVGNIQPTLSLAAVGIVASLGREIAKDIEDMEGDQGRNTLPQRVGKAKAAHASAAATFIAIALSPVPLVLAPLGLAYLAVIAIADATFFYAAVVLRKDARKSQKFSKIGMAIATLAFALGGIFR